MAGGSSSSLVVVDADVSTTTKRKTPTKRAVKAVPQKKAAAKPVSQIAETTETPKVIMAKKKAPAKAAPKTSKKTAEKKAPKKAPTKAKTQKTKKSPAKETTDPLASKKLSVQSNAQKKAEQKIFDVPKAKFLGTLKTLAILKRQPLGHLLVEQMLLDAGFRGTISTDRLLLEQYATDESIFSITPQIVLQPEDTRDVEKAVCVIAAQTKQFDSLSLTPRAAGTGLSGGSLTDSIVIDVAKHLNAIDNPVVDDAGVTITCQPGAYFRDVEKKLKTVDAYLPAYPASKDICTIGGAVANNAAGPDSLKYGHMANAIQSLDIVLADGKTYTVTPLSYSELKKLVKKKNNLYAQIAKDIFTLIEKNEKTLIAARPKTKKNTAGYPLWDVLDCSVADFKKGKGTFNLNRIIAGSQGTIGIITSLTLHAEPIQHDTTLIMLPIFDLACAGRAILQALEYNPVNIEVFDALSFELALKNPEIFRERITGFSYYKVMYTLYTTYHVKYRGKIPDFTILITLDNAALEHHKKKEVIEALQSCGCNVVRFVKSPEEKEMWWQVRRASYTLSKKQDSTKRPAAFLEDMTVPPQNLFGFFADIQKLFETYNVTAAVHGHGGNGHFHFYPLLDFEKKETPGLIEKMSEDFFACAIKHGGSLCGEHNDGIIRTPHLSKMFTKPVIALFEQAEHIFDPDDIFNPGKKTNPRFDVKDSIRKIN